MINIICIGNIKDNNLKLICDKYIKRILNYSKINITELSEENLNDKTKLLETNKIIDKIHKLSNPYVIVLDLKGKSYTSDTFSKKLLDINTNITSNIVFVIGGSLGLDESIKKIANETISFSTHTFPHQLIRLFLLEQIYRSYTIINNVKYHK